MASLFRPWYTRVNPRTGERVKRRAKKWYGQWTDAAGRKHRKPLSTNKTAAQWMLGEILREVEKAKAGLSDKFSQHASRQLTDHLDQWERDLRTRDVEEKHVRQTLVVDHF